MSTHYLQDMVDGMSARNQKKRSQTQCTLGKLIGKLEDLNPERLILGIAKPHSYRGFYSDLSFEPMDKPHTVGEALAIAKSCMGEIFQGWKGGDFQMGRNTPVWIAFKGDVSEQLMDLDAANNTVGLVTSPSPEYIAGD